MTLVIPRPVLVAAGEFFEDAGSRGCEGTGMLAGIALGPDEQVSRFFAPTQRATSGSGGGVEVTQKGKLELVAALRSGERWVARVHSHPATAFHSYTDDANPVITAEGSWSIVVPYWGLGLRHGIQACAVLRRERGMWRQLDVTEINSSVRIVD